MEKAISASGGRGGRPPAGKAMTDRKTVERNRRHRMKDLCTQLFSLLPPQHFITSKVLFLNLSLKNPRQVRSYLEKSSIHEGKLDLVNRMKSLSIDFVHSLFFYLPPLDPGM